MVKNIQQLLEATPFTPFTIVTSGGSRYRVPTADHMKVVKTWVVVWFDDESLVTIPGLHIASLEQDGPAIVS